jgi:hypothetical protein
MGCLARQQILAAGVTANALKGLVRRGQLIRVLPTVYVMQTTQMTWTTRASALSLWLGASGALSHRTAALLHGFPGFRPGVLEAIDPRRRKPPREGIVLHQAQLDDVDVVTVKGVSESPLETRIHRVLRDSGLPLPSLQYEVVHHGKLVARVDFAWPSLRVAVECESYEWHSDRKAWHSDTVRFNALAALGWIVVRATNDDACRPHALISTLRPLLLT